MTFLKHILTGLDGETYDIIRVLSVLGVALGLVFETYAVFWHHPFDIQAFGIGFGALLTAAGVGLKLNDKEPGGEK